MHNRRWDKLIMLIIQVYLPLKKIVPYEYWRLWNNSSGSDYPNSSSNFLLWRNIFAKHATIKEGVTWKYFAQADAAQYWIWYFYKSFPHFCGKNRRECKRCSLAGNAVGEEKAIFKSCCHLGLPSCPISTQIFRHESWNNQWNQGSAWPKISLFYPSFIGLISSWEKQKV